MADQPLFRDLSADNLDDLESTVIESLCMNCHEQGETRLLLTKIPFFKSVVISSFDCSHCHSCNSEIQPAGSLQPKGCIYDVQITSENDLNRQVVKTNSATIKIPVLDFEIPAFTQKGTLTTVEGIINRAIEGLEQEQPVRRALHPEVAEQIDAFISKLKNLTRPFHIILDDPSGNSFVENPHAPQPDPTMKVTHYQRTKEQQSQLGYQDEDADMNPEEGAGDAGNLDDPPPPDEVFEFPANCPGCDMPSKCRMKPINIPFFKEVIIMATACDSCGHKSNEIKSGGGVEEKGRRIRLKMTDASDLSRDVLRSGTCIFEIPDLEFWHSPMTTTGGKFTTIEGLLTDVKQALSEENPFVLGDSAGAGQNEKMKAFFGKLDKVISGETFVTIVLTDPAGNSYLQNVYAPEDDPEMSVEDYERSEEENDSLGLTHMNTENYMVEGGNAQDGTAAEEGAAQDGTSAEGGAAQDGTAAEGVAAQDGTATEGGAEPNNTAAAES